MSLPFKRVFTFEQMSRFFHYALMINVIGLLSDIVVYRYFPSLTFMKIVNANLSNASILMVCLVLISQAMIIFVKRHKEFVTQYKLIALTIMLILSSFFFWVLHVDNNFQENLIIFLSSASRHNHDIRILFIVFALFLLLVLNLYRLFKHQETINEQSVAELLTSTFTLVIKEYFLIFLTLIGLFRLQLLRKFALKIIGFEQGNLEFQLTLLEYLIPIIWLVSISYYLHQKMYKNSHL